MAAATPTTTVSNDALLLVTMCMIGLPVEVQVKDGSLYSGVFHTASPHHGYGVVLKKVKKIGKGKDHDDEDGTTTSMALGDFVDTLVVLPEDLVQVLVKDFVLPSEGSVGISCCKSTKQKESFTSDGLSQEHEASMANTNIPLNASPATDPTGELANSNSTSFTLGIKGSPLSDASIAKTSASRKTGAMESKLNPSAKVFLPSVTSLSSSAKVFSPPVATLSPSAKVFSPSPVSPLVNSNYVSNTFPEVPTGGPVIQTNILPSRSSLNGKAVAYNKLDRGNCGNTTQYFQPIMEHNTSVLEPAGVGFEYQSAEVAPKHITPTPQPVMSGKSTPFVYVHPVSQSAIQGAPITSQGWCRPILMSPPYQGSIQKYQGASPLYMTPPVMVTGNQPLVVPSPAAPFMQPFPALRPVVPAGSGVFISKYQYSRS